MDGNVLINENGVANCQGPCTINWPEITLSGNGQGAFSFYIIQNELYPDQKVYTPITFGIKAHESVCFSEEYFPFLCRIRNTSQNTRIPIDGIGVLIRIYISNNILELHAANAEQYRLDFHKKKINFFIKLNSPHAIISTSLSNNNKTYFPSKIVHFSSNYYNFSVFDDTISTYYSTDYAGSEETYIRDPIFIQQQLQLLPLRDGRSLRYAEITLGPCTKTEYGETPIIEISDFVAQSERIKIKIHTSKIFFQTTFNGCHHVESVNFSWCGPRPGMVIGIGFASLNFFMTINGIIIVTKKVKKEFQRPYLCFNIGKYTHGCKVNIGQHPFLYNLAQPPEGWSPWMPEKEPISITGQSYWKFHIKGVVDSPVILNKPTDTFSVIKLSKIRDYKIGFSDLKENYSLFQVGDNLNVYHKDGEITLENSAMKENREVLKMELQDEKAKLYPIIFPNSLGDLFLAKYPEVETAEPKYDDIYGFSVGDVIESRDGCFCGKLAYHSNGKLYFTNVFLEHPDMEFEFETSDKYEILSQLRVVASAKEKQTILLTESGPVVAKIPISDCLGAAFNKKIFFLSGILPDGQFVYRRFFERFFPQPAKISKVDPYIIEINMRTSRDGLYAKLRKVPGPKTKRSIDYILNYSDIRLLGAKLEYWGLPVPPAMIHQEPILSHAIEVMHRRGFDRDTLKVSPHHVMIPLIDLEGEETPEEEKVESSHSANDVRFDSFMALLRVLVDNGRSPNDGSENAEGEEQVDHSEEEESQNQSEESGTQSDLNEEEEEQQSGSENRGITAPYFVIQSDNSDEREEEECNEEEEVKGGLIYDCDSENSIDYSSDDNDNGNGNYDNLRHIFTIPDDINIEHIDCEPNNFPQASFIVASERIVQDHRSDSDDGWEEISTN